MNNVNFSHLSNESLFSLYSEGNKEAGTILFNRFEFLGRQIAGSYIRQNALRGYTDNDFIEVIHDSILKSFSYYHPHQLPFYVFCRELLNQNVSREIENIVIKNRKRGETLELDCRVQNDSNAVYHDIVADKNELDMSSYTDISIFLDNLSSSNKPKTKLVGKIYILHLAGYSIRQIAKKLNKTVYEVSRYLNEADEYLDGSKLDLNLD